MSGPSSPPPLDRRLSVAPMLDCTDRHERYLLRLITRRALLYSEMVVARALVHAGPQRLLGHTPCERPLALQLGGSEPALMADGARMAVDWGYDEVNINVGCPSERVQEGAFGACLMAEPQTVAACVRAMVRAVRIPVTVKTRIGIDRRDAYEDLLDFVRPVADAGCRTFVVHARKAWLQGLSPRENRSVPPLRYDTVYRLKQDLPDLQVVLNGGVTSLAQACAHLGHVDGVMIGREAYHNPWVLAAADRLVFGESTPAPARGAVLEAYLAYAATELARGTALQHLIRHLLGLAQGLPGARTWRRCLSEAPARLDLQAIRAAWARVREPA